MKKAINLERADGKRIQFNADDIQFIEEASSEGKTNVMVRHFGQVTVAHDFIEVMGWLDVLYGRKQLAMSEGPPEEPEPEPLHTDRSRKSVLGMMKNRHEPEEKGSTDG